MRNMVPTVTLRPDVPTPMVGNIADETILSSRLQPRLYHSLNSWPHVYLYGSQRPWEHHVAYSRTFLLIIQVHSVCQGPYSDQKVGLPEQGQRSQVLLSFLHSICGRFGSGMRRGALHRKRKCPPDVPSVEMWRALVCCGNTDVVEKQVV